ncbi:MAG: ASCH domain-containing protein [Candidatus Dormibacteraeota bacterium]|uniref:ASCH domain-containing protein n=1 Tax=Candidatus Amunia macphersoniae TaxID=3127014 RepID=A0A934NJV7_9BACT|nr:ASCH domain-containing protein [Candidatus Dormibacteraeota bacterium]
MPRRSPPVRPYELGAPRSELRKKLVAAVLRGEKTATASLRSEYEPFTAEPLPRAREWFFLAGYSGEPLGTIEVIDVKVVALNDVDLQFAIDEGEGYTTVADWRAAGLQYWSADRATGDTLVVCERFRLV